MGHNLFFDTRFDIDPSEYAFTSEKMRTGSGYGKPTKTMLLETAIAMGPPRKHSNYAVSVQAKNRQIPAGYTYLAQFIAHDLNHTDLANTAFDPTDKDAQEPTAILELAHLYGEGPGRSAMLFVPEIGTNGRWRLAIGPALADKVARVTGDNDGKPLSEDTVVAAIPHRDVPRLMQCPGIQPTGADAQPSGNAVIADPRNDENLLISQLTCLFIRAHNRIANQIADNKCCAKLKGAERAKTGRTIFPTAKRMMMYAYHRIIVYDFLRRLLDTEVFERLKKDIEANTDDGFRYVINPSCGFTIPHAFSRAAFRIGHVMAQNKYRFNGTFSDDQQEEGWELKRLLDVIQQPGQDPQEKIFPVRAKWVVDWNRFFFSEDSVQAGEDRLVTGERVNFSHPIGLSYPQSLIDYPKGVFATEDDGYSVPYMDLARGLVDGVPTAEEIFATHPGIVLEEKHLTEEDISAALQSLKLNETTRSTLAGRTPLLLYILIEAQKFHGGARLGPLGSTIIGEVLMGAVMSAHRYGASTTGQNFTDVRKEIADDWQKYFGHPAPSTMPEFLTVAEGSNLSTS